jgi:hypothetical protein
LEHLALRGREAKDRLSADLLLHGIGVTILNCRDALVQEVQGHVAQGILRRISSEPLGHVVRDEMSRLGHGCYQPDGNDFRHGIVTTTFTAHLELLRLLQGYLERLGQALVAEGVEDSPWLAG